jgi:hypothetical protein
MTAVELRLHPTLFALWSRHPVPPAPTVSAAPGAGEVAVEVGRSTDGDGWGEIRVDGRPVDPGLHAYGQVARVVDPDAADLVGGQPWHEWLARVAAGTEGQERLQRALAELVHHAAVRRAPRPLPVPARPVDDRLGLRVPPGYLDRVLEHCPGTATLMEDTRRYLADTLGITLPPVTVEEADLPDGVVGVRLGDLVLPLHRGLAADEVAVRASAATAALPGTSPWRHPYLTTMYRLPATARESVEAAGNVTWDAGTVVVAVLDLEVRRRPEVLVDEETVLAQLRQQATAGLLKAVDAMVGDARLVAAVRVLLAQRLPAVDLVALAERLVEAALAQVPDRELPTFLRAGLPWAVATGAGGGRRVVDAHLLDPAWPAGPPDEAAARLRAGVRASGALQAVSPAPVLLAGPGAGPPAAGALGPLLDDVVVVEADELPATALVNLVGRVDPAPRDLLRA